jgi:hypothetical protein
MDVRLISVLSAAGRKCRVPAGQLGTLRHLAMQPRAAL